MSKLLPLPLCGKCSGPVDFYSAELYCPNCKTWTEKTLIEMYQAGALAVTAQRDKALARVKELEDRRNEPSNTAF